MTDHTDALVAALRSLLVELADEAAARHLGAHADSHDTPYLTVPEAAERLRAKPQRVYDLLSDGRLTRCKDGSRVLVRADEIDDYLEGRPTGRRGRHSVR